MTTKTAPPTLTLNNGVAMPVLGLGVFQSPPEETTAAVETALAIVRAGGAVGRVGVPQHEQIPTTMQAFYDNVTIGGGPAPARAYIEELLPDVLEGRIEPGRVLDRTGSLDEVPEGYRLMNEREVLKFQIKP